MNKWTIHMVADESFYEYMCDAHTHGLDRYGSYEIQMVLNLGPNIIGAIINDVGERIRNGLVLHDGGYIEGVLENGVKIKVFETKDEFGKPIFRLLLPDEQNRFPGDTDIYPYNMQLETPYRPQAYES